MFWLKNSFFTKPRILTLSRKRQIKAQLVRSSSNQIAGGKDEGAVTIIVAIFIPLVVVGLLAIVVDVGLIYRERRELVRAADSLVLFLAQECATGGVCPTGSTTPEIINCVNGGSCPEPITYSTKVLNLGKFNSADGLVKIDDICGFNVRGTESTQLRECDSTSSSSVYKCEDKNVFRNNESGTRVYSSSFVRAYVSSKTSDINKPNFLALFFSKLLPGVSGDISIGACSQAGWSPALAAPVVYPLALPLCNYKDAKLDRIAGFKESDRVYNDTVGDVCSYVPLGSETSVTIQDKYYLKGATIYNEVDGEAFRCPSPFEPKLLRLGQRLKVLTSPAQIVKDCDDVGLFSRLGITAQNGRYGTYLDRYLLNRELYLPVMGECLNQTNLSQCQEFKIVGFTTFKVRGIILLGAQGAEPETGSGSTGYPTATSWANEDCATDPELTGVQYCVFGEFKRSAPPTRAVPFSSAPPAPDAGSQQVFLIP